MSTVNDTTVIAVTVTVAVDIHGVGHVTCTPYDVYTSGPATLQFNMATPGWQFPVDTPVYLKEPPPPNDNFPNPPVYVSSTQVTWDDVFASTGDFTYTVCAQKASGGPVCKHDPVIHNNTSTC
jgi:hypothetical protein